MKTSLHSRLNIISLSLLCGLALGTGQVFADSATFTSGSGNWTCPAGVTSVQVEMWGGGGGGGGANPSVASGQYTGGGGGGGAYTKTTVSVTPGNNYAYSVGVAGTAGVNTGGNGGTGGTTSFAGATDATGGAGGGGTSTAGVGGTAGGGASGFSSPNANGGTGAAGSGTTSGSGGGGASGSAAGDGGNGAVTAGGTIAGGVSGTDGGNGAAGKTLGAAGGVGTQPGGGGSGGFQNAGSTKRAGGAGGAGKILLTYTVASTTYYSQGSLDASALTSWNSVAGGGGSVPTDFNNPFIVQTGHAMTLSQIWRIPGTDTSGGSPTFEIQGTGSLNLGGFNIVSSNTLANFLIKGTGSITGSGSLVKSNTTTTYLGLSFGGGINLDGGNVYAISNNVLSSGSATITFRSGATASLGAALSGTATVANPIDFSSSTSDVAFRSLGGGSTLELTTSTFNNAAGGAGSISISSQVPADAAFGVTAGTGAGTVKFSGTGFTIGRAVVGNSVPASGNILELAPASDTQTWNGNFTNVTTVTKSGAGTVAFGGTFNGTLGVTNNINDGTLRFTTAGAGDTLLGANKAVTINIANLATAVWDLNGVNQTVTALTGAGSSGQVTLGGATLTISNAAAATTVSTISGAGTLVKSGAGILTLSSSSSYTGGTSVTNGTISLGSGSALGTGVIAFAPGTVLDWAANSLLVTNDMVLAPGTGVNIKGNGLVGSTAPTLSGQISGSGGISHTAGHLVLTGSNIFTGGFTNVANASPYTIQIGNKYALGRGVFYLATGASLQGTSDNVVGGLNGPTNDIVLTASPAILIAAGNGDLGILGNISGDGGLSKASSANVLSLYGSNTYTGPTFGSNGKLVVNGSLGTNTVTSGGMAVQGNGIIGGDVIFTNTTGQLMPGDLIGGVSTVGKLTMRNLTIQTNASNAGKISFDFDVGASTNDRIACVDLNLNTNTPIACVTLNGKLIHGRYRLIDYSGAMTGNFSNIISTAGTGGTNTTGGRSIDVSITNQVYLVVSNVAPVAAADTFSTPTNVPLQITIANLLTNDTDADLDTLHFVGTGGTLASVTNNGTYIYVPGQPTPTNFTYTIQDGNGGTNTGNIFITLTAGAIAQPATLYTTNGTTMNLTFFGVINAPYNVERSTNDMGSWQVISNTSSANGVIQLMDDVSTLVPIPSSAYYRLTVP